MVKSMSHGFHSFRRFRETHLSEMECNSDVKLFWMGWSPKTMAEVYSRLKSKEDFRLKEAERIGIGFDPLVRQIVKQVA